MAASAETRLDIGETVNTVTIHWRWVFVTDPNTDHIDTDLGIDASATITVTAVVTVTQVD
jgi:hypothetical protein